MPHTRLFPHTCRGENAQKTSSRPATEAGEAGPVDRAGKATWRSWWKDSRSEHGARRSARGCEKGSASEVGEAKEEAVTKEQMLQRIDEITAKCGGHYAERIPPDAAFNGALTLMIEAYGRGSAHVNALLERNTELNKLHKMAEVPRLIAITDTVNGMLQNLRREVEDGLLTSLERRVQSEVIFDFIELAKEALARGGEGPQNVASVLAAAAFEDTLRRIAKEQAGLTDRPKLETVIFKLKEAGLLVSPQLPAVLGYLPFRNHALHAEWEQIDRSSVKGALVTVEELLLKHFA